MPCMAADITDCGKCIKMKEFPEIPEGTMDYVEAANIIKKHVPNAKKYGSWGVCDVDKTEHVPPELVVAVRALWIRDDGFKTFLTERRSGISSNV